MNNKLDSMALGYASALTFGLSMLVLGILGNFGLLMGAVDFMLQIHVYFSLSFWGVVAGILEAGITGFVGGYLLSAFYNRFSA